MNNQQKNHLISQLSASEYEVCLLSYFVQGICPEWDSGNVYQFLLDAFDEEWEANGDVTPEAFKRIGMELVNVMRMNPQGHH